MAKARLEKGLAESVYPLSQHCCRSGRGGKRKIDWGLAKLKQAVEAGTIIIAATHDNHLISITQSIMLIKKGTLLTADTKKHLEASKENKRQAKLANVVSAMNLKGSL